MIMQSTTVTGPAPPLVSPASRNLPVQLTKVGREEPVIRVVTVE
jgi:hypothetical protein